MKVRSLVNPTIAFILISRNLLGNISLKLVDSFDNKHPDVKCNYCGQPTIDLWKSSDIVSHVALSCTKFFTT
ncbi:17633_t:CDS:2 [Entrophospora sp. SA101]|nr:14336_t:CDS:2 [Entrophospora sp. SA101]CAJ0745974.1 3348_t:CDS:2 [Entrophospora sp. SA101]CAJ0760540.1 17633_t:CDS:2 [Entrophospora sp. SA101]CAJ0837029.1 11432_t:CDS:2 [Entrophospora sp. SA101]